MHRRNLVPGLALIASASLFACSGGSPEQEPAASSTIPHTMAPQSGEVSLGKDASQMPIRGKLDALPCLTLRGMQALFGRHGTSPLFIFGDSTGVLGGYINIHGDELRAAADALKNTLVADGSIPADLAHVDALASVSTTERAASAVDDALLNGSMSFEPSPADTNATVMLDQARAATAKAIGTGCYDTFPGRNFSRAQ